MTVQNPNCTCPTTEVTVTLPVYVAESMTAHAARTGNTVDGLVEAAFSFADNRVDPCIATPS